MRPLTPRVGRLRTGAPSCSGELGVRSPGIDSVDTEIAEATTRRDIWVFVAPESELSTPRSLSGRLCRVVASPVEALAHFGVSRDDVEAWLDEPEAAATPIRGHIPFTANCKKALELALREAIALGHNYIGTEHLLLGLRRTTEGRAAELLAGRGVELEPLRTVVVELAQQASASSRRAT